MTEKCVENSIIQDSARIEWLEEKFKSEYGWLSIDVYWMTTHASNGRNLRQAVDWEIEDNELNEI